MCAFEYHIFFRYHIIGDIFGRKFQLICKCATNNRLHPWRIATLNSKMDLDLRLTITKWATNNTGRRHEMSYSAYMY